MKELKDLKLKNLEQLQKSSKDDLQKELESSSKNLYVLRMKHNLGELKQTHHIKVLRRYIARLKTLVSSK